MNSVLLGKKLQRLKLQKTKYICWGGGYIPSNAQVLRTHTHFAISVISYSASPLCWNPETRSNPLNSTQSYDSAANSALKVAATFPVPHLQSAEITAEEACLWERGNLIKGYLLKKPRIKKLV